MTPENNKTLQKLLPAPIKTLFIEGRTAQELEAEHALEMEFWKIDAVDSFETAMKMYDFNTAFKN